MASGNANGPAQGGTHIDLSQVSIYNLYKKHLDHSYLTVSDLADPPKWCEQQFVYKKISAGNLSGREHCTGKQQYFNHVRDGGEIRGQRPAERKRGKELPPYVIPQDSQLLPTRVDLQGPSQYVPAENRTGQYHPANSQMRPTSRAAPGRSFRQGYAPEPEPERDPPYESIGGNSVEEEWARRLLETLVCLKDLKEVEQCYNVHVWGILQNEAVYGYISDLRSERSYLHSSDTHVVTISCQKTQNQLLEVLIFSSGGFDFGTFWSRLHITARKSFSPPFREDFISSILNKGFDISSDVHCLDDMGRLFNQIAGSLADNRKLSANLRIYITHTPGVQDVQEPHSGHSNGNDCSDSQAGGSGQPVSHNQPEIKEIPFDRDVLNEYITSILQLWHGQRSARGVRPQDAGRCSPKKCKYELKCPWRATEVNKRLEWCRSRHPDWKW